MNTELTFRLAQTSDFDEILKLSEGVYDGQDYLPLRFHKWMQMVNVAVMLAHSSGRLIGLVQCSVVGRTAVRQAARVLPEFRGRGVYKRLSKAMNEFVRRHYPAVQREMFTSNMCHFPAREITEMRSIRTSAVNKSLFALESLKVNFSDQVEPCMKEYLCEVIFTSPFARNLFPYNSIILDWIPMEPLQSNIDHFHHELGHDFYTVVDKCGEDAIPRSVSFGVLSPRTKVSQNKGEDFSGNVCPKWNLTKNGQLSSSVKMRFNPKKHKRDLTGRPFTAPVNCFSERVYSTRQSRCTKCLLTLSVEEKVSG
ncbi:putative N-acetyltransferase 16 [Stylophora pistillata]|uniref:Putative N-acetyltransferase 16 n=1 Tax=Stylophora pistillata TaxID=50429 RepID=A0A2B4R5W1_STYPI|nr:putative N-acetyltransferase 16 [Stylophora pistillata]